MWHTRPGPEFLSTAQVSSSAAHPAGSPTPNPTGRVGVSTRLRLGVSALAGVVAGIGSGVLLSWQLGIMIGWMVIAAVFLLWTWLRIGRMDAPSTARHALREDPGRRTFELAVLFAALASLIGVGLLLADGSSPGGKTVQACLCIAAIFLSWGIIQTVYTVRYAELYYTGHAGGIDFNEHDKPDYVDFAYLAFTLGMTYQVSDTDIGTKQIRATALRHALLSYLFGAVIIAATINLIAGLAK